MRLTGLGITLGIFIAGVAAGCSSSSTSGDGGGSGGATGSGGASGSGGSGAAFMAISPCTTEASYMAGTAVTFDMGGDTMYTPKCLKVTKGATVTFTSKGGDFAMHPLSPSKKRGDTANNPIKATSTGTMATFTFDKAGFFPYYCTIHGFLDSGGMMDGIVWAQ
jgi:plastocyanin